jgi:hypothetical protein
MMEYKFNVGDLVILKIAAKQSELHEGFTPRVLQIIGRYRWDDVPNPELANVYQITLPTGGLANFSEIEIQNA